MSDLAIKVHNLGKKYMIGGPQKRFDRIGDQLVDLVTTPARRLGNLLRGKPSGAAELEEPFWALEDINLEIHHGDVVGIIGHNGAGKSTLLKILSRITEPTKGYAEVYGRISSLLEVGTGFHPELTGRENIFLNGAILGMRRNEIQSKFDSIVDFAEIEKFIDTPVKHYSSGMYVRLAFSVAAHLEPEILLVDEVLAVGDIAFQRKCLGKMDSVSRQGRTVIFVSHNMNAIQRLCPETILIERGKLRAFGKTDDVIEQYLSSSSSEASAPNQWLSLSHCNREGSAKVQFTAVKYTSSNPKVANYPYSGGPLQFAVQMQSDTVREVNSIAVTLYDRYGTKLVNADTLSMGKPISLKEGINQLDIQISSLHLNPGLYMLGLWAADPPGEVYDHITSALPIEVIENEGKRIRVGSDGLVPCEFSLNS